MTTIPRARTTGLVIAFVLACAAWSANPAAGAPAAAGQDVDRMRAAIAVDAAKDIERQGGSRILFKVDAAALHDAMVTELRDDVYRNLHDGRIPFTGLAMRDGGVEVRIAEASDRQRLLSKLVPATEAAPSAAVGVADGGDGLLRLRPTDSAFAERLHALVGESIEMIEQRLRNGNIGPAGLQPDGIDRILVLLPGVTDPDRVAAMFAKQARVSFRLVDTSMTPNAALQGSPPSSSEVLYDFKTRAPYLLLKDVAMDGDDITEAAPGFDPGDHRPIASFRFNARGARRFAHVTEENVGKPFAIVVDDDVLSVAVIREPIRGGSGQISGNFTLQDAATIVMLLRSGTLPGRLSVVDKQVAAPAGNGGKQ